MELASVFIPRVSFLGACFRRYVKGAELMNVNSQVQIRQLLFPGECAEPVKTFKASNPEYDPNARPRMRRWIDFELHGIWGKGEPGRLTAEVKTSKGTAAVSGAVLWSLVGKPGAAAKALVGAPGAAAKALAELDAKEAAAAAAADGSVSSSEAGLQLQQQQQEAASVLDDALSPHDLQEDSEAAGAAGAVDEDVLRVVPGGDLTEDQLEALQQEAAANKWGKMYAAMGGGREGLEACVALEKLIEVRVVLEVLLLMLAAGPEVLLLMVLLPWLSDSATSNFEHETICARDNKIR